MEFMLDMGRKHTCIFCMKWCL